MSNKIVYGIMLALLLVGVLVSSVKPAKASVQMLEAIYIRADGTIEPEEALQCINTTDYTTYILTDNIISRAVDYGIVVERNNTVLDGRGYTVKGANITFSMGIYLYGVSNVTIKNVNISLFFYGIYLEESSYNTIAGNNITKNWFGVYIDSYCNNNTISGNNIMNNGNGITLEGKHTEIEERDCFHNSIIENNIVNNTGSAITLRMCHYNSVIGNNITGNKGSGIYLSEYSSNNVIHHNNFTDNGSQAKYGAGFGSNVWDNGTYGNYWSDYKGWDGTWIFGFVIGRDGIGDQPYVIDEINKDRYPLTTNYPPPDVIQIVAVIAVVIVGAVYIRRKRKKA